MSPLSPTLTSSPFNFKNHHALFKHGQFYLWEFDTNDCRKHTNRGSPYTFSYPPVRRVSRGVLPLTLNSFSTRFFGLPLAKFIESIGVVTSCCNAPTGLHLRVHEQVTFKRPRGTFPDQTKGAFKVSSVQAADPSSLHVHQLIS